MRNPFQLTSFCALIGPRTFGPFTLQPPALKSGLQGFDVPDSIPAQNAKTVRLRFSISKDFTYLDLCSVREMFGTDLINVSPGEPGYYGDYDAACLEVTCTWQKLLPLLHTVEETEKLIKEEEEEAAVNARQRVYREAKALGLKVEDPDLDTSPEKPFNPVLYPAAARKPQA